MVLIKYFNNFSKNFHFFLSYFIYYSSKYIKFFSLFFFFPIPASYINILNSSNFSGFFSHIIFHMEKKTKTVNRIYSNNYK